MRILHLNNNYRNDIFYKNLYDRQAQAGDDIAVFTPVPYGLQEDGRDHGPYWHMEGAYPAWNRPFFLMRYRGVLKHIERWYDPAGLSLIHAHALFSGGYPAWVLSRKWKVPFIAAVRDSDVNGVLPHRPDLAILMRRILRDASRIVYLSETYRRNGLRKYLPKADYDAMLEKSVVIPNGVAPFWLERISPAHTAVHDPVRILFVGRIFHRKNLPNAAKAIEILNERGIPAQFTVVGRQEDAAVVSQLRQMPHTRLLDPRPMEELLPLYRESDLFLMPSRFETFGLVYVEAMTQGLPVIYSRGQGFDGQFPEGEVGFAVDPDDPAEIADKISLVLEDYSAVSARCVAGCRPFDWDLLHQRYCEVYQKAVSEYAP
ncbi:MAG: glycosyltransferase family 4 protein [Clostridia bacterium]|nr:glycosyltransferase family 4 protein [Clostridia bacterium]